MKRLAVSLALVWFFPQLLSAALKISLLSDAEPGRATQHGIRVLRAALEAKGAQIEKADKPNSASGDFIVVVGQTTSGEVFKVISELHLSAPTGPESLLVHKAKRSGKPLLLIAGSDDRGLMYALLDVADRVSWATNASEPFSEVRDATEKPDVSDRALSIYTFQRAAFEQRFFDEKYWERSFDMLARDRFNSFVLIFGYENGGYFAPAYPWFFDVEGFPGVNVPNVTRQQQERNLRTLNHLIEMAHDRGLRFSVGLWDQIYVGGVQSGGMTNADPKVPGPDRVWGLNETNLLKYSPAALAKFLKLVPGVDGIQFRMHDEGGLKPGQQQHAFWKAMFEAVKGERPTLPLTLRAKGLPDDIIDLGLDMGLNVRVATKYWMEQVGLPFHPTHIVEKDQMNRRHGYADLLKYPQRYKMHWRLWTAGTIRVLLWGDPEYARRFAESTHLYDGDGFEVTEPIGTKMQAQPHDEKPFDLLNAKYRYYNYEFERYWHFYQVFGRMAYNPNTPSEVWDREFVKRFGPDAGPLIEKALHQASWILPRINASVFPYRNFPTTRGWAEKQRWGDLAEYAKEAQGSDIALFQGIEEGASNLLSHVESAKLSPEQNSAWFARVSQDVLNAVREAEKRVGTHRNREFNSTIVDLKILANLAAYHADRISAASRYAFSLRTHNYADLDEAIRNEQRAVADWTALVAEAADIYSNDLKMGRSSVGLCGNWRNELVELRKGLEQLEDERRKFIGSTNYPRAMAPPNPIDIAPPLLQHTPISTAIAGHPLRIKAKVSDPSGVKWVRLRFRPVNQTMDYDTLEMNRIGTTENYEATVPGDKIVPTWDFMYYFEVMDNAGNGKIYPDFEKETPYIVVKCGVEVSPK